MTTKKRIMIRPATDNDAPAIACAVAMAIGDDKTACEYCGDDYLAVLTEIARTEGTQYSWQHALVAEVDGSAAGAVVGYDGASLSDLRENTFAVIRKHISRTPTIPNETGAGEFYLDSVSVFPEFRGLGIGKMLIMALCELAFYKGHKCVGLLVDIDNRKAEALYRSLGFKQTGTQLFFGHQMRHLQKEQQIPHGEAMRIATGLWSPHGGSCPSLDKESQ